MLLNKKLLSFCSKCILYLRAQHKYRTHSFNRDRTPFIHDAPGNSVIQAENNFAYTPY